MHRFISPRLLKAAKPSDGEESNNRPSDNTLRWHSPMKESLSSSSLSTDANQTHSNGGAHCRVAVAPVENEAVAAAATAAAAAADAEGSTTTENPITNIIINNDKKKQQQNSPTLKKSSSPTKTAIHLKPNPSFKIAMDNEINSLNASAAATLSHKDSNNHLKIPSIAMAASRRTERLLKMSSSSRSNSLSAPPGVYFNDGHRQVDFTLVYDITGQTEELARQRRYFEKNLQREGLVLELDPLEGEEPTGKLCFVKIHATWETLCRGAEMLQMKMPLRNTENYETTKKRHSDKNWCSVRFWAFWFHLSDVEEKLIGSYVSHITAQFTRARVDQFLINDKDTFFSPTQRIRIVYDIMQRAKCDPNNSKKRGLQWLLSHRIFLAAYPPHDGGTEIRHLDVNDSSLWSHRQILRLTWANFNKIFKAQPLHLVRAYFGEKVGFYFAWLGFYTKMLIFPSVIGLVSFLYGIVSLPNNPIRHEICDNQTLPGNLTMCPVCRLPNCNPWQLAYHCESAEWNHRFDHESHVFVAVFTLLWATIFLELWKRREAELAYEWDAYDMEQDDSNPRPEYEARTQLLRVSPVTNEEEPYISKMKRIFWFTQSLSGLMFLISLVVAALVGLIVARILFYGFLKSFGGIWFKLQFEFASLAIHVLTFVVVMTLGWIYEKAAHRLTELECPRTQSDYLASYIWKVFIFELLNNFAPIFYAALIRGRNLNVPSEQSWLQEMCDPGGCLNEVVQAISILLLARLLISNAAELGVPFLRSLWKDMKMGAVVGPDKDEPSHMRHLPRWHKDYALNEPDLDGVYAEYLEMMVQFGYVTLFVAAFPLAPLICLLNNIVEIRLDATNFVLSFRRPLPVRVAGIRIWRRCLNIIVKLAVLCNGGFLAFTSEIIPQMVYRYAYSKDGTLSGYVKFTLAKFDTTNWPDFVAQFPNITHCYYRDFREDTDPHTHSIIWWQIMVARLAFFIVFVIVFYFVQWLCDFLVPDVPEHIKVRIDKSHYIAKQALYGHELKTGIGSCTPSLRSSRIKLNDLKKYPSNYSLEANGTAVPVIPTVSLAYSMSLEDEATNPALPPNAGNNRVNLYHPSNNTSL